jgi:sugar phosphate isomerase/epimerase
MQKLKRSEGRVSRRQFLGTTAAAFSVASLPQAFSASPILAAAEKPNSNFGGVHVGAITYSWRSMPGKPEDIIQYCTMAGIDTLELMGNVAEDYAGIPSGPPRPPRGTVQTEEERAAFKKAMAEATEARRRWRISQSMDKYEDLRKWFNDAGINIHIAKFSPASWTDEEIDYSFKAARALGAKGVCNEIGDDACKRLAPFAEKHKMFAVFHQHAQPAEPGFSFDRFLAYSPAIMLNFDVGHYYGCTGLHPNGIIERLHDRILSLHLKDLTGPKSTPPGTNQLWGKGETPLADVLKLVQKQRWPIHCDIELEYEVPADSDAAKEVKKCVDFVKAILIPSR